MQQGGTSSWQTHDKYGAVHTNMLYLRNVLEVLNEAQAAYHGHVKFNSSTDVTKVCVLLYGLNWIAQDSFVSLGKVEFVVSEIRVASLLGSILDSTIEGQITRFIRAQLHRAHRPQHIVYHAVLVALFGVLPLPVQHEQDENGRVDRAHGPNNVSWGEIHFTANYGSKTPIRGQD